MENKLTLDDSINILKKKMESNTLLREHYWDVVYTLGLLYNDSNVDDKFHPSNLSDDEIKSVAEDAVISIMGKPISKDHIIRISLISNKRIYILMNVGYTYINNNPINEMKHQIARKIYIFTGYNVSIDFS